MNCIPQIQSSSRVKERNMDIHRQKSVLRDSIDNNYKEKKKT